MNNIVSTREHYERLIDEGNDPCMDSNELKEYMDRWTGPSFMQLLDINKNKVVLEIGIGTGRLARKVLKEGCKRLVGLDISPKTLARAKDNLNQYDNIDLLEQSIIDYECKEKYDVAYSVLTFLHIENKKQAIKNIINVLKKNGVVVISLDSSMNNYLDYGTRQIITFSTQVNSIVTYLKEYGCEINEIIEEKENGVKIATIIKATKGS